MVSQNVSKRVQVRPGDQPGYPKDTIESFVGHSSMGLLCPPAWNYTMKHGSFTSMQMCHTHTPCRSRVLFWKKWQLLQYGARISVYLRYSDLARLQSVSLRFKPVDSEAELEDCCRAWIASGKLMCANILHESGSSPDAVAAVNDYNNCLAKVEVVVTCPIATCRKGLFPCSRGNSKWWRQ